jgi:hypothetical protein
MGLVAAGCDPSEFHPLLVGQWLLHEHFIYCSQEKGDEQNFH